MRIKAIANGAQRIRLRPLTGGVVQADKFATEQAIRTTVLSQTLFDSNSSKYEYN